MLGDVGIARGGFSAETLNPGRQREGRGGPGAYSGSVVWPGEGVNHWSRPVGLFGDLGASFSPEPMGTYVAVAEGDPERAVELYAWNTVVSAAFYEPLQGLEVALRNAMHVQLARCYGEAWYDNPAAGLDIGTLERIAKARTDLARAGQVPTPSRVVAELSFGVWVALVGGGRRLDLAGRRANYEMTLWRPALSRAFPHRARLTRAAAHRGLNPLCKLRNRIAHHEPIFTRRLDEDHTRILQVTGWISPRARAWIECRSRVPLLLEAFSKGSGNPRAGLPEVERVLCDNARRSGMATEARGL